MTVKRENKIQSMLMYNRSRGGEKGKRETISQFKSILKFAIIPLFTASLLTETRGSQVRSNMDGA